MQNTQFVINMQHFLKFLPSVSDAQALMTTCFTQVSCQVTLA